MRKIMVEVECGKRALHIRNLNNELAAIWCETLRNEINDLKHLISSEVFEYIDH